MPVNLAALRSLIVADPSLKALAEAGRDADIADALNAKTIPVKTETLITKRIVLQKLGILRGTQVMAGLKAASQSQHELAPVLESILWLLEHEGLDIGHPDAETFIPQIVAANLLTQEEAALFLALATTQTSRAISQLSSRVTADEVSAALAADRPDHKAAPIKE